MSEDADKQVLIAIKTTADLAGAKAAESLLESTIAKKKFLGQSYEAEASQLAIVKNSLTDYAAKTVETGEKVEGLELNHHALHEVMHLIGHETAPELGEALTGAMHGPIGIVLALGAAFQFLARKIEEDAEKTKELADRQSELNTAVWQAQRDAANSAAEAANNYAEKLIKIRDETDKVKQAEDLEVATLHAKQDALKLILEAQEKAELAAAGGDKIKEEEIRSRYGAKKSSAELATEGQTLATENNQLYNRNLAAGPLDAASKNAEAAYESSLKDTGRITNEAKLKQLTDAQGALDKEAGKYDLGLLRKQLENADTNASAGGASEADVIQMQITAIENHTDPDAEAAIKAAAENRAKVAELNATMEQQKIALDKLKEEATTAADKYKQNQQAIDALTAKIKEGTAVYDIHKSTAETVKQIEAPQTPYGKVLTTEKDDALKVLRGQAGNVSDESKNLLTELGAMMTGHAVTLQQASQLVVSADANNKSLTTAIQTMTRIGEKMVTFSQASATKFSKIESDIEMALRLISDSHNR